MRACLTDVLGTGRACDVADGAAAAARGHFGWLVRHFTLRLQLEYPLLQLAKLLLQHGDLDSHRVLVGLDRRDLSAVQQALG
jgi:hypothetical protein